MNNSAQAQNSMNPPRCECHECTQARWKTSMQGQLSNAAAIEQIRAQAIEKLTNASR